MAQAAATIERAVDDYRPDLIFRAGFSTTDQPVGGTQALFNVLAPAVVEDHWTLGMTKKFASDNEFSLSVMYAPKVDIQGTNPNPGPQTGSLFMEQWDIEVGWVFKL